MFNFTTSLFKAYLSYYIHDIFECKNSDTFYFILYCKLNIFDSYKQFDRKKFENQFDDILNDNINFFRQHLLFYFGSNLNGITPPRNTKILIHCYCSTERL